MARRKRERTPTGSAQTGARGSGRWDIALPAFRDERWHLLAVAAAVLALYLCTMPRTITLEDSGLFCMSAHYLGISHPPGYPLYNLLGKLCIVLLFPVESVVIRLQVLSALLGAASCVALFWIARCLVPGRALAYAAALMFAASRVFWSQSIIVEVYTLNTFFSFLLMGLSLHYLVRGARRTLYLLSLVYGLSLTNSWPLVVLSSPCLLLIVWPRRQDIIKELRKVVPFVLAGLLPYVWMYWWSRADRRINFYGPMENLYDFWFYITRKGYAHADTSPTAGVYDLLGFQYFTFVQLFVQYTVVGGLAAAFGLWRQWRRWPKHLGWALVLGFLGSSFVLPCLLRFDYEFLRCAVLEVFPLVPYAFMALWIALALHDLHRLIAKRLGHDTPLVACVLSAVAVVAVCLSNYRCNQRKDYTWAQDYGKTVLDTLDRDAVLITHGDFLAPIGYLRYVAGVRPDVTLYNDQGLIFSNRLFEPRAKTRQQQIALVAFIKQTDRPVYYTGKIEHNCGVEDFGLYKKIDKQAAEGSLEYPYDKTIVEYFDRIEAQATHTDDWTHIHRGLLLEQFAEVLGHKVREDGRGWPAGTAEPRRQKVLRYFPGKLGCLKAHLHDRDLSYVPPAELDLLWEWIREAEEHPDPTASKKSLATLYMYKGIVLGLREKLAEAAECFKRSCALNPNHKENDSIYSLLLCYVKMEMPAEYFAARKEYLASVKNIPKPYDTRIKTSDRQMKEAAKAKKGRRNP